jgi:hypothetical protein
VVVILTEGGGFVDLAGEVASAQGAVGYEADPQFLAGRQYRLFRRSPPTGILALDGRHRLHRMNPPNRMGVGFGQAEVLDLALGDQVLEGGGDILDPYVGVDTVLVKKVGGVDPQALQRSLGDPANTFGATTPMIGRSAIIGWLSTTVALAARSSCFASLIMVDAIGLSRLTALVRFAASLADGATIV